MNKPSLNPYERPPGSSFEWPRDSFEWPKAPLLSPEEKLEKERKLSERQKEVAEENKNALRLASYHRQIETKAREFTNDKYDQFLSLPDYAFWDSKLFLDTLKTAPETTIPLINTLPPDNNEKTSIESQNTPLIKETSDPEKTKQKQSENMSEKDKVKEYAVLSNLAYATYEKVNKGWQVDISNLKVKEVNLDIAWIDFKKLKVGDDWKLSAKDETNDKTKLTPDETFVVSYFNKQNNHPEIQRSIITDKNDRNVDTVISVALLWNAQELNRINSIQLADASNVMGEANSIKSDAGKWSVIDFEKRKQETQEINKLTEFIEGNRPQLNEALIKLKETKTTEYQTQLDRLKEKWNFKILAHYPEENSNDTTGFQCVLFEKDGNKVLSIAGTQLNSIVNPDWKDIGADIDLFNGKVPEAQTKALIDFMRKNLNGNEKVAIVGHSLGGALAQIGTAIYGSSETYTFNSPWAKELKASLKEWDPYEKELKDFTKNRTSDTIAESITNVKGSKWLNIIAGLWVDIWNYKVDVETSSHSIIAIIEAVEKVDKLVKKRVDDREKLREDKVNGF